MRWRAARLPHRVDGAHLPTQRLERTGGVRSCTTVCDVGRKERSGSCTTGQESATRPDDCQSLCRILRPYIAVAPGLHALVTWRLKSSAAKLIAYSLPQSDSNRPELQGIPGFPSNRE